MLGRFALRLRPVMTIMAALVKRAVNRRQSPRDDETGSRRQMASTAIEFSHNMLTRFAQCAVSVVTARASAQGLIMVYPFGWLPRLINVASRAACCGRDVRGGFSLNGAIVVTGNAIVFGIRMRKRSHGSRARKVMRKTRRRPRAPGVMAHIAR